MSVKSKTFLVGKNHQLLKKKNCSKKNYFNPNFCHPHSVPMSTNEFARSYWSSFLFHFIFLNFVSTFVIQIWKFI